ncbi:hypothetical protein SUNI508_05971 [Seiridium unicorne]|uniref:Uncharacterized protein n=1 Tax=Seiridium unicorne TaxID=138068 RepID=A0ABR2V3B3_9PEZI
MASKTTILGRYSPGLTSFSAGFDFKEDFLTDHEETYTSNTVNRTDDLSNYHKCGTKTYAIIIPWGHTKDTTTQKRPLSEDRVTVACVRANVTMPGSQVAAGTGLKLGVLDLSMAMIGAAFALLL